MPGYPKNEISECPRWQKLHSHNILKSKSPKVRIATLAILGFGSDICRNGSWPAALWCGKKSFAPCSWAISQSWSCAMHRQCHGDRSAASRFANFPMLSLRLVQIRGRERDHCLRTTSTCNLVVRKSSHRYLSKGEIKCFLGRKSYVKKVLRFNDNKFNKICGPESI